MSGVSSINSGGGGGGASNVTVDYIKGYVNAGNSSTTPLAANGVFTGTAIDVTDFAVINVNVYADVASATNGVTVQFSPDGTNWDHSHSTTYTSPTGVGYIFNVEYKYARVVYTNSGSAQTAFRLQTILKPTRVQSSLLRLNQNPTDYYFAELTKSVIQGKTTGGGGNFVDVKVTPSGSLTVALGDITGVVGQNTMANSLPVTIASNQTAVPVSDNGGSITVDGTVAATQSGAWTVTANAGTGPFPVSDNGGSLTVDGVVTANAGTGTFAISAASLPLPTGAATETTLSSLNGKVTACNTGAVTISTALPAGTNNIGDVDVLTLPNVTLASQANPFTSAIPISDNAGSLTIDGSVSVSNFPATQAVSGTVTANAGTGTFAISASSLPLPNGAATESTLSTLNSKVTTCNTGAVTISTALPSGTNNIGDVDVISLPNVTLASQTNPFSSAIPVSDNGGSLTIDGTVAATQSGNWSVRNQDGSGNALTSRSVGSARAQDVAIVDGSGNQITSFGGGTEYTEDVAAAADPIGKATILVRADTPAGITSANGDNVAQRGTNYGAAFVQVLNSTGSFVDSFGGGTQYADGASAATPTGNQINWNESGTQRAVTLSKALPVQPGTGSVFDVEGNVASDGVDSGNPVKIGAIAKAYGTTVTVGADDRTDLRANRLGVLQTIGGALNTQCVAADYSATAQTNTVLVATTSVIVVTRLSVFLSYNTSVAPFIRIGLGGSTTPTTTNCIIDHENVVPGSIITIGDGSGIIAVGAVGEDLRITCGAATDGSWNVSVTYFEVAS